MTPVTLEEIRALLVENCMLKIDPATIGDDTVLLGPEGLGLDSLDALQLTVGIEAAFKTPLRDPALARRVLHTPRTIREWIDAERAKTAAA